MLMLGTVVIIQLTHHREFARNRIRSRFRDNLLDYGAVRRDNVLKRGRSWLGTLKKANLGDTKAVTKVLEHTYGRRGKRKHELLAVTLKISTLSDVSHTSITPLPQRSRCCPNIHEQNHQRFQHRLRH